MLDGQQQPLKSVVMGQMPGVGGGQQHQQGQNQNQQGQGYGAQGFNDSGFYAGGAAGVSETPLWLLLHPTQTSTRKRISCPRRVQPLSPLMRLSLHLETFGSVQPHFLTVQPFCACRGRATAIRLTGVPKVATTHT